MKKLSIILLILGLTASGALADNIWRGSGESTPHDTPEGTTEINDIDTVIFQEAIDPLERLLEDYREGAELTYSSGSTLIITPGQIACQNAAGTRVLFSESTANINATFAANLDTGSESGSKTYYVYGIASLTSKTFTIKFSTSSSAPTGSDYFVRLGSFYNNSSSNINLTITNDNNLYGLVLGSWVSKSTGTSYLASTDGFVVAWTQTSAAVNPLQLIGYSNSSSPPTTVRVRSEDRTQSDSTAESVTFPVKKGDYYKVTVSGASATMYWIPNQ